MKTYRGYRRMHRAHDGEATTDRCIVTVEQPGKRKRRLPLFLAIRSHSPTGFEWGYGGSGPAQLALALVADCCGRSAAVPSIYQRVKRLVAGLPKDGWALTEDQVRAAVEEARKETSDEV